MKDLGSYLGVPLIHAKVQSNKYDHVVDKVRNRLVAWKAHTLSTTGRLIYAQSILSTILVYTAQTVLLPMKICHQLDKLVWDFFWGTSANSKTWHLISWEVITKPKLYGGLELTYARDRNLALLAKLSWRLLHEEKFWVQLIRCKYLQERSLLALEYIKFHRSSSMWHAIIAGTRLLKQGIIWRVGNGRTISFRRDH